MEGREQTGKTDDACEFGQQKYNRIRRYMVWKRRKSAIKRKIVRMIKKQEPVMCSSFLYVFIFI